MRTFIAVNFDNAIKKQLADLQAGLKPHCGKLKWVDPNIMHLTLKFLGDISDRQVAPISHALDELAKQCRPFDIAVEDIGTFPPHGGVKVIWIGIKDPDGLLAKCQGLCEDLIEPLGFPKEKRRFSPHLTLARNRDPGNSARIRAALAQESCVCLGTQSVAGVTFYQSTLTPKGPIYQPLSRHLLSS